MQRIEYVRTVYRQLQFSSVRQFSRTASLSSGSANDIRSPELPRFPRMRCRSGVCAWHQRYTRSWCQQTHVAGWRRCRCTGRRVSLLSTTAQGTLAHVLKRVVLNCSLHSLQITHSLSDSPPLMVHRAAFESPGFSSTAFSASPWMHVTDPLYCPRPVG